MSAVRPAVIGLMIGRTLTVVVDGQCPCRRALRTETTRERANEEIVVVEQRSHRTMSGFVEYPDGTRFENVLVEVFDHPEIFDPGHEKRHGPEIVQHRIAACVTGINGRFCFGHLRAGKYEVRASVGSGRNWTHVVISLAPKSGRTATPVVITMRLGT